MKKQILELLTEAETLIRKEAEREKKNDVEPKLFTEMLKDITFYIEELKEDS
jgi:hypothetical protein